MRIRSSDTSCTKASCLACVQEANEMSLLPARPPCPAARRSVQPSPDSGICGRAAAGWALLCLFVVRRVFDEPAIPRDGWLRGSEPMVSWFRESTRPEAVEGRRVINDLYSRFPDTTGRMVAELRSTDDRRLYSALDELFV